VNAKEQKGKAKKRKRSWHHGPLEDRRFKAATDRLDNPETHEEKEET
jgi:hypothetical protein